MICMHRIEKKKKRLDKGVSIHIIRLCCTIKYVNNEFPDNMYVSTVKILTLRSSQNMYVLHLKEMDIK